MKKQAVKKNGIKIGVIGLGYVGLPLAVEFGKLYEVAGFDVSETRIAELKKGFDKTLEVDPENLKKSSYLKFTSRPSDLKSCNYYIVTVPTPVNEHKIPDLGPLLSACETVGGVLSKGDIVI
ncbi:MAG TPA: Vi polysaccharide biosynthesis UDP-N-acetylglucosamine C-6 dehydrogenase TviB, partial [Candidatus Wallbacteria bacterium]|nr:Vi polysaccharide biosynthesis UDP-N-acetylglucosamine C-6 dehydrogenase TviB [Candidatus Wallbacteria bacterium]